MAYFYLFGVFLPKLTALQVSFSLKLIMRYMTKISLNAMTDMSSFYSQNGCSFDGNFANFLRDIGI